MERQELEIKAEEALNAMRKAVRNALLEKKRRGQYAIFCGENGESIRVEAEDISIDDMDPITIDDMDPITDKLEFTRPYAV